MGRNLLAVLSLWLGILLTAAATPALTLTVIEHRGVDDARAEWLPLAHYLQQSLAMPVALTILEHDDQIRLADQTDLIVTGPVAAVQIQDRLHAHTVAASLRDVVQGERYAGVIVVPASSAITTLADLHDLVIGVVNTTNSGGGFLFQSWELSKHDIDARRNRLMWLPMKSQRAVLQRVAEGRLDAGFIRSGLLEEMAEEGFDVHQVRVLNPRHELAVVHSTDTYPQWTFLMRTTLDATLRTRILSALMAVKPTDEVAIHAHLAGFGPPQSDAEIRRQLALTPTSDR